MKRSEMVYLMSQMIRLYRMDDVGDMEAADRLLKVMEQEGILPPLRTVSHTDDIWDSAICAEMDGMEVKVAMWDQEESVSKAKKKSPAKRSRSGIKKANH